MINTKRKITYTLLCAAVAVLIAIAAFVFTGIGTTEAHAATNNNAMQRISETKFKVNYPGQWEQSYCFHISKTPLEMDWSSVSDDSHSYVISGGWDSSTATIDVSTFPGFEYGEEYYIYLVSADGAGGYTNVVDPMQITFRDLSIYPQGLTLEDETLIYKYVPDLPQALSYQLCIGKGHWDLPDDSNEMHGIGSNFSCSEAEVITISLSEYIGNTIELGYEYTISVYYFNNMGMQFVVPNCVVYATFGDVVPLPDDPIQEGHHFVGWYYDEEFTTPYAGEPLLADTQLFAKFAIDTFTVTYDASGGTKVEAVIVDWNTVAPVPETTRTGYDFLGWFTSSGEEYDGAGITEDTLLTARWEIKVFTVTFYTGNEVYKSVDVEYGTRLVDAMEKAKIVTWAVQDVEGARVSKTASIITDNTAVLVHDLSKTEKIGDYIGSHPWTIYATCALIGALLLISVVSITVAAKRK